MRGDATDGTDHPVLGLRQELRLSARAMRRAEATDVANAVLDGVDGILLGAETLRGKYAVQTVQTILAICHQAEKAFDHNYHFEHLMQAGYPFLSSALPGQ